MNSTRPGDIDLPVRFRAGTSWDEGIASCIRREPRTSPKLALGVCGSDSNNDSGRKRRRRGRGNGENGVDVLYMRDGEVRGLVMLTALLQARTV